jgi:hypothetical protein
LTIEAGTRDPALRDLTEQEIDAVTGGATALDGLETVADLVMSSFAVGFNLMTYVVGYVAGMAGSGPRPSAW